MALDVSSWKHTLTAWSRPVQPFIDAVQLWLSADGLRMSAALSFYGMLSLSPLLLLLVALLGWWLDRSVIEGQLMAQATELMGEQGASVLQAALSSTQAKSEGRIASIVSVVMLASGATGVFGELQNSMQKLWTHGRQIPEQPPQPWWSMATIRLRGLGYVLVLGLLLLTSMVLSAAIKIASDWAGSVLPIEPLGVVLIVVNEAVAYGVSVLLFWGVMRLGEGPKPATRYLLFGAVVGAALFTLGKQAFAWYLSSAAVVSAYGAAGSLVVLLMWMYFTSAILLYAAACARAASATNPAFFGNPTGWRDPVELMQAQADAQAALLAEQARRKADAVPLHIGQHI